jgi:hypothetical protein
MSTQGSRIAARLKIHAQRTKELVSKGAAPSDASEQAFAEIMSGKWSKEIKELSKGGKKEKLYYVKRRVDNALHRTSEDGHSGGFDQAGIPSMFSRAVADKLGYTGPDYCLFDVPFLGK